MSAQLSTTPLLRACRSCSEAQAGSSAALGERSEHTEDTGVWADPALLSVHTAFATINKNIQKYKTV